MYIPHIATNRPRRVPIQMAAEHVALVRILGP